MSNELEYKGYKARIEYSADDNCLYGKILGINDLVMFDAEAASEIATAFHEAVNGYLQFCKSEGKKPDKQFSGSFNVRIAPELHRNLSFEAEKKNKSMNQCVGEAIKAYLEQCNAKGLYDIKWADLSIVTGIAGKWHNDGVYVNSKPSYRSV